MKQKRRNKKHNSFGPLIVTIQGVGQAGGKTRLQFLLADFLTGYGHKVFVSDTSVSQSVFDGTLRRHGIGCDGRTISQAVYLHVSPEIAQPEFLSYSREPRKWPKRSFAGNITTKCAGVVAKSDLF